MGPKGVSKRRYKNCPPHILFNNPEERRSKQFNPLNPGTVCHNQNLQKSGNSFSRKRNFLTVPI